MGIILDPTPVNKRWGGSFKPLIEAVTELISQSYVNAGFKLHDAIKSVRSDEERLEQRAWTLWQESVALCLNEFFETAALTRRPDDAGELQRLLDEILDRSAILVESEDVELTALDLKKPTDFRLYQDLRQELPGWALRVAPAHLRDDRFLRRRLDRAFVKGFHRARFEAGDHFEPITRFLSGEGAEALERQDRWQRYYEILRADVEDQPLFGQEGGGPSLADIFVPLRCSWYMPVATRHSGDQEKQARPATIHLRWLADELKGWLKAQDKADTLRVVTGGPGCGKSSAAKMLAHEVARAEDHDVFLVPLQGLDVSRKIDDIVESYIADARIGGGCLPESPVGWAAHASKPLLLIFDGLDEVARSDGVDLDVTRQFLGNLRAWLGRANSGARAKVMAIAIGRPQAAEESAKEIGGLDGKPLLYVEPLCALSEDHLKRGKHEEIEINDPADLAALDHRRAFWDGYARFDPRYRDQEAIAFGEAGLDDLTIEPLLLYLLMFSGMAGS